MSEISQEPFTVPTQLTLGGAGLESITAENYSLLLERLKLMGIEPIEPPKLVTDYPIYRDNILAKTEEIGYPMTIGSRTWNALTGRGNYPRTLSLLSPLTQPNEADLKEIEHIPDWMHGLYLTPESLSCRGLNRALAEDRIRSLPNISDAGHNIVAATVLWAQQKIAE